VQSDDEIADALTRFPQDLAHFVSDQDAVITEGAPPREPDSVIVMIQTSLDGAAIDEAVKRRRHARPMSDDKPVVLYPFRLRDVLTGKWYRARWNASLEDIEARGGVVDGRPRPIASLA
jgi:hypothetical protein